MPDASLVKQLVTMSSERVRSANVLHGGLQKRAPSSIVAIAASSCSLRRKLHGSSRFWRMRAGVTDFGDDHHSALQVPAQQDAGW